MPFIFFDDIASASQNESPEVQVIEISGFLDPIVADMLTTTLREVSPLETLALVFQVDSSETVVSDEKIAEIAELIQTSPVPVSFWVGPSGARATGKVAQLLTVASDVGIAPGSRIGRFGDLVIPLDHINPAFISLKESDFETTSMGYDEVINRGFARPSPVLLEHLVGIDGFQVTDKGSSVEPVTRTQFRELGPSQQFFHSVASPAITYLLFIAGMGLLIFELYTAGVGVAGLVGAFSLLLGGYGLAILPTREWSIAILILAMVGYAVDVQTGVPRFWTVFSTVALVVGSLFLFDGVSLSWITQLAGISVTVLVMAGGMPAMIRTRFATPTIDRGWLSKEIGTAVDVINPEGTVEIRGVMWRARTSCQTPISIGSTIRVISIDDLWLEVESIE